MRTELIHSNVQKHCPQHLSLKTCALPSLSGPPEQTLSTDGTKHLTATHPKVQNMLKNSKQCTLMLSATDAKNHPATGDSRSMQNTDCGSTWGHATNSSYGDLLRREARSGNWCRVCTLIPWPASSGSKSCCPGDLVTVIEWLHTLLVAAITHWVVLWAAVLMVIAAGAFLVGAAAP